MRQIYKYILLGIIIILLTTIVTGCWDRTEIEERLFVFGVGISQPKSIEEVLNDLEEKARKKLRDEGIIRPNDKEIQDKVEEIAKPSFREVITRAERRQDQLKVTIEAPIVRNLVGGEGGGNGEPTWIVSTNADTVLEACQQFASRSNRRVYLGHLKSMIIKESLAREGVQDLLDFFERDNEVQRRVNVFVCPENVEEILALNTPVEQVTSSYISMIVENKVKCSRVSPITLGEFMINIHTGAGSLVPRIVTGEKDVKVCGSAIFRGEKMVGWLGELETQSALRVKNATGQGEIIIPGLKEGNKAVYESNGLNIRIKPIVKKEKITFKVEIKLEGNIVEIQSKVNLMNDQYIKKLEKNIEEHIKKNTMQVIDKAQQEFQTDFFGFGEQLRRHEPKVWKKVKKNWHKEFAGVKVRVEPEVKIRRIGLVK
ncbi:Ger(x)C family spore germination protein [Selenihalanaerobacter shriftii]|uniref:Spore germination protein KC n=1 Tax=Selenihalanaerobacter shriftii TaxID=142842 RepID=A0A1T4JUX1_9FIRM|nr:Ger(x)C family spore germination protein [Selenihalanaerobacter shriftii]SJZ33895.1 spore germination protein KC [Selenihalanaerobacter shriftii]